jgi:hypothetical protein
MMVRTYIRQYTRRARPNGNDFEAIPAACVSGIQFTSDARNILTPQPQSPYVAGIASVLS